MATLYIIVKQSRLTGGPYPYFSHRYPLPSPLHCIKLSVTLKQAPHSQ